MPDETLGALIDQRHRLKAALAAANKAVDAVKAEADEVEGRIMQMLIDQGITGAAGAETGARVLLTEEDFAQVTDWTELYSYIHANNAFHLLQRRVASTAAKELREAGTEVPGLTFTPVKKLHISSPR